jgi:schlafen family protein
MTLTIPPAPTAKLIEQLQIVEGQHYDFKSSLNLGEARAKSGFIDDVVAFLNAGHGHLIVGVQEKKGAFDRFEPLTGDPDQLRRQITSVIQDNILPKPLKIAVEIITVEGGFLIDIQMPEHRLRPYQNKINGAFYLRTGAQNTPIPRDQVYAMFVPIERMEQDVAVLMEREDRAVDERDIMQKNGVTLHIAIVPQQHYERARAPFDPGRHILKAFGHYHGHGRDVFKGCEGGVEVRNITFDENRSTSRFFIGDDWLIHSYVAHPFSLDESGGRVTIHEFKDSLEGHLSDIALLLDNSGIPGSFCILLAVRNLHRNPKLIPGFPNAKQAAFSRGMRTERVDDPEMISRFYDVVRGVSLYGR